MKTYLVEAGLVSYGVALQWQERLLAARQAGEVGDILLLLEHPPVFTFGKQGGRENLLVPEHNLEKHGITLFNVGRGGNVTYHEPGQLVGYPILYLKNHRPNIRWYVHTLEEVLIRTAADCGVTAGRCKDLFGVWSGPQKLASIGVAVRRWVTMHGFAINVSNELSNFSLINPCGLRNTEMTSLSRLAGRPVSVSHAAEKVKKHFADLFGVMLQPIAIGELLKDLSPHDPDKRCRTESIFR